MHELGAEALHQLELLIMRAPPPLRFVLATRHDVQLGLHRLRLEGELAEIREPDLRFTVAEAQEMFDAAGVRLPGLGLLVERTEGWAAGLRLAALSLARHPAPGRFAEQFSGTERTVADYLLAEVLDRQSEPVRRLLLRTSILHQVTGELADLLTGDSGGERVLQDLEQANAFVTAVDASRSWFRYHQMFADLLQLQLRQMRPVEAESWVQRAERVLRAETEPAAVLGTRYTRGKLELARGRDADALASFQAGERLGGRLTAPHMLLTPMRAMLLHTLVRLGDVDRAEQVLADLGEHDRDRAETCIATAVLRLAQDDPHAAAAALAPVLDGSAPVLQWAWLAHAFLLEAIAQDALGDAAAADRALERALDLAEPDGALLWFLLHPVPGLLERHARHGTAHAALTVEILSLLAGQTPALPAGPQPPLEPLSSSEIRVLRYLPTNLTMPEIAGELYVSHNTVRTHMRHLYTKLGTHRRAEAVARARDLGLLAPSALRH